MLLSRWGHSGPFQALHMLGVRTFGCVGVEVTGAIAVIGVVLLWLPRRQVIGAAVLGGTMVGGVLTHWFILGPSAVPAIVLGLLSAAVLYIYRTQIPEVLGRKNSSQAKL